MPEDIHMRLRRLREAEGWTQKDVAEKLGVAEQTVSAWELGPNAPSRKMQPKVKDLYGVSLQYLLTGSNVGDPTGAVPAATLKPLIDELEGIVERARALIQPAAKVNNRAGMPQKLVLPKSDTHSAKEPVKRRR